MTSAAPSPVARGTSARRGPRHTIGFKALIASASMAVVFGGWAVIAAQSSPAGAGAEQPALAPLPTLVPPPGVAGPGGQPAPPLAAPSSLRSVSAPLPVAVTRASR